MAPVVLFSVIFLASLLLTMVGLGGGLIFAPLFVVLEYPLSTAVSVSLFLNGIAAISATITYFHAKMVDLKSGLPLIVTSTLVAPLGALLTNRIEPRLFTAVLALVILLAAGRMIFSKRPPTQTMVLISTTRRVIGGGIIGLVIGTMAGFLGIGGGLFVVPLLIYILKMPTKIAAATSLFVVVFSSFSGFLAHISLAEINWRFILVAAIFSFVGGQIGSRIMIQKLKSRSIRVLFGFVLLLFSANLFQKTFM